MRFILRFARHAITSRLCVALLASVVLPPLHAQSGHTEPSREQWQRVDDIFKAMGVEKGSHVADIGAGGGFFTTRLAKAVGENGRVYAVDVNPISLRELKTTLGESVTNVELIRGEENDPRLPAGGPSTPA